MFLGRAGERDPFSALVALQRDIFQPVFLIIPTLLVWSRRPQKLKPSIWDILFGSPEAPSAFATAIALVRNYKRAFVHFRRAIDLASFDDGGATRRLSRGGGTTRGPHHSRVACAACRLAAGRTTSEVSSFRGMQLRSMGTGEAPSHGPNFGGQLAADRAPARKTAYAGRRRSGLGIPVLDMSDANVWPGKPYPLGATFDGQGVNFAVYSRNATGVEVCLFDPDDPELQIRRVDLTEVTGFVWHGYIPGVQPGALYGYHALGPYDPQAGLRYNGSKLLVDPYARALCGTVDWKAPVYAYPLGDPAGDLAYDELDDAKGVPKSVVLTDGFDWEDDAPPDVPWHRSVIYELHVRGFTMRHPQVPPELRGTFAGLASPPAIEHLRKLGVTAVELMPVQESIDEPYLLEKGLRNYWGYSTLGFFAPNQRYASDRTPGGQVTEFKEMVKQLHLAGIEVIIDVVYNHTCEGNHHGPTLSWKGLANEVYYRLSPADRRFYVDYTGCGNSLAVAEPQTLMLVMDSLRYWATHMHVDGFRFDLATTLARDPTEFDTASNFLQCVHQNPTLARVKLIAEPWDLGPNGYRVGEFPVRWSEWNDRYRDVVRRFWKGDENQTAEMGYRLTGSSDLYERAGRKIYASVNFVTAHDGFTLRDLVSYDHKHNEPNQEENRDGSDDNASWNCGAEGETDDPEVNALRDRQQRNLLATLLVSQGVPMLVSGDEMGKTQGGNNNAYCQDNEISWLDWDVDGRRRTLLEFTARMIRLRLAQPVLQRRHFFRGGHLWDSSLKDLAWFRPDGTEMTEEDWQKPFVRSVAFLLGGDAIATLDELGNRIIGDTLLVLLNAHHEPVRYTLPEIEWGREWQILADTAADAKAKRPKLAARGSIEVVGRSLVVLSHPASRPA